jgi:threonine/homoserine/homoserine lactone efflux protein
MYSGLPGFTLASLLIELTPGPNMAYLALIAATEGRKPGLAALTGVALGLGVMGLVAALGLASVIAASPAAYAALTWAGAAYLLWLAWEGWRGADEAISHAEAGSTLWRFFGRGLITNLLNPKAAVFYITVLPGFLTTGSGVIEAVSLSAVYVAVATGVHLGVVLAAGSLQEWLADPTRTRGVRRGLSLALVGVAFWVLVKG